MILGLKISTFITWIVVTAIIGYIAGYITGIKDKKKKKSN